MNTSINTTILIVALILGLSITGSAILLKKPISAIEKFEIKQEGPVFVRFDKITGQLCYTGIAPNGSFIADAWLCLDGNKAKPGPQLQKPESTLDGLNLSTKNTNTKNQK